MYKIINKTKMMESPKYMNKIVPPLTLSRANALMDIRKQKIKPKEEKPLNILTRTLDGINLDELIIPQWKWFITGDSTNANQNWTLDEIILFYSDSTIKGTFMNPNLFTDNTTIKNHLHMSTNAVINKMTC